MSLFHLYPIFCQPWSVAIPWFPLSYSWCQSLGISTHNMTFPKSISYLLIRIPSTCVYCPVQCPCCSFFASSYNIQNFLAIPPCPLIWIVRRSAVLPDLSNAYQQVKQDTLVLAAEVYCSQKCGQCNREHAACVWWYWLQSECLFVCFPFIFCSLSPLCSDYHT